LRILRSFASLLACSSYFWISVISEKVSIMTARKRLSRKKEPRRTTSGK
jgi:hypothetical protein